MSELSFMDKLLDGVEVEWKPLGNLAVIGTGKSNRQDESENGIYPFYVRSKNILKSDTFQFDETAIVVPGEGGIGDIFHYVQGKYALHQRAYRIHVTSNFLSVKFLYHFMSCGFKQYILMKSVGATSISIRKPMLEGFQIPIPCPDNPKKSLEIQAEIVRILDAFTAMTTELTTELNLRKKQYNHYRDQLLSFEEGEVEWKTLGEVAVIGTGSHDTKDALDDGDYIFYARGREPLKLDVFDFDETAIITAGDGAGVGKVYHYAQGKYALHQRAYRIVPGELMEPRFVFHYISAYFYTYIQKASVSSSVTSLRRPMFLNFPIPVPPLAEQARIVSTLDKFDALTNSITEGLPREIELRQKQYEYYRDLLLSFPKPNAEVAA
jgi:type I restriction enzyme S subunit